MVTKQIQVRAPHGLHLRVAAQIVKETQDSQSSVIFLKEGRAANASSILDLLGLGASERSMLKVVVNGKDEQKTIEKVSEILMDGAGI